MAGNFYWIARSFEFQALVKTFNKLGKGQFLISYSMWLSIIHGAVATSAQFPVHVWLPDAMVGPTPILALIPARYYDSKHKFSYG